MNPQIGGINQTLSCDNEDFANLRLLQDSSEKITGYMNLIDANSDFTNNVGTSEIEYAKYTYSNNQIVKKEVFEDAAYEVLCFYIDFSYNSKGLFNEIKSFEEDEDNAESFILSETTALLWDARRELVNMKDVEGGVIDEHGRNFAYNKEDGIAKQDLHELYMIHFM